MSVPGRSRRRLVGNLAFAVVFVALHFVNQSRTGRAWRSQREDPLAAEVMVKLVELYNDQGRRSKAGGAK